MALTAEELKAQRVANLARGRDAWRAKKQAEAQTEAPSDGQSQPEVTTSTSQVAVVAVKTEEAPQGSLLASTIKGEEVAEVKKPKAPMLPQQWQSAFSREGHTQAIDYLASPGADTENLLMRTDIAERRVGVALSEIIAKADEFKNSGAMTQAKNLTAVQVSIKAMGRNQIVQAIVGGNPDNMSHGSMNFVDRIKEMAFGKKKKPAEDE